MSSGWLIGAGCGRWRMPPLCGFVLSVLLWSAVGNGPLTAAVSRTPNFVVTAATRILANRVSSAAEVHRRELAVRWLGHEMPRWSSPCRVLVRPDRPRAAGSTTFSFRRGEVFGWQMTLQGPDDEVLESILPHELTHAILACRFRRPVPRWADEGAAVLAESTAERRRQRQAVRRLIETGRQIPLVKLLAMSEYPTDRRGMLSLYAQGVSLVSFLVERGGRARFLAFLDDAGRRDWDVAVRSHYGSVSIAALEREWSAWVVRSAVVRVVGWRPRAGGPGLTILRGQSPETISVSAPAIGLSPRRTDDRRSWTWRAPDPRRSVREAAGLVE